MSTGQISSRVGDSASNPSENSPNTVQTVNGQDETHISSFINRANAQVEAAIAHLLEGYAGSGTPDGALYRLSDQIKNIISLTFGGTADISPGTTLPIYVQVPDSIIQTFDDEQTVVKLLSMTEALRDIAELNLLSFDEEHRRNFDIVFNSFSSIVEQAQRTFHNRALGQNPICPVPTPTPDLSVTNLISEQQSIPPLIIQVPDFIAGYATSEERGQKLQGALAFMCSAAMDKDAKENEGKNGRNYLNFTLALNHVIVRAVTLTKPARKPRNRRRKPRT
jgi:hypothetical protein